MMFLALVFPHLVGIFANYLWPFFLSNIWSLDLLCIAVNKNYFQYSSPTYYVLQMGNTEIHSTVRSWWIESLNITVIAIILSWLFLFGGWLLVQYFVLIRVDPWLRYNKVINTFIAWILFFVFYIIFLPITSAVFKRFRFGVFPILDTLYFILKFLFC